MQQAPAPLRMRTTRAHDPRARLLCPGPCCNPSASAWHLSMRKGQQGGAAGIECICLPTLVPERATGVGTGPHRVGSDRIWGLGATAAAVAGFTTEAIRWSLPDELREACEAEGHDLPMIARIWATMLALEALGRAIPSTAGHAHAHTRVAVCSALRQTGSSPHQMLAYGCWPMVLR